MQKICFVCFLILALAAACSRGYFVDQKAYTDYADGRELYISKCNSCHQLYNPHEYTITAWDSILTIMKMKAKIDEEQKSEIHNWIIEVKSCNTDSISHE